MPNAIRHSCSFRGCPVLTDRRYCEKHAAQARSEVKKELFENDANALQRDKLYHSARWRKLRILVKASQPRCVTCGGPPDEIDHIIPVRLGGEPLEIENLQALCHLCHQRKTSNEANAEKGKKVYGK